ncbi:hypothetical protein HN51_059770 [Arachis hypogaea]|uniref:BURP domain-containing protein n=1 Tax=Arachis hypogaea TaxID=3818 RepID=A0A444X6Z3_ARAHY|nr:BURP domain protein RD22 [Arachis hypogaea]QHN83232.1 Dehydration-responsive protein [Arachis hypogaea]RYQ85465.1 hypothetical protein Ahy_B10g105031 [Arachis hypogaea]
MDFPLLLPIFAILNLVVGATHGGALSPELYWKSVLPTTPMPKAITNILHPDWREEKGTYVGVGKGGVNVQAGKGKPGGTAVNVGHGGVNVNTGKGTNVNVGGKGGVSVHAPGKHGGTNVNVGGGRGVSVNTGHGHKGKPVYVGVGPNSPFIYRYAASETQLHDDPNVALFFLQKDLHPGTKFNLHFTKTTDDAAAFLPRQVADSLPFSSNKVEDVFSKLSVDPQSDEANAIKNTIKECEEPGIKGEEKYCATSLESMVDFSTSKLGKNIDVVSTEISKETKLQSYNVAPGVKKINHENKAVVCHKQNYPYALFYCHKTETTMAFKVPLEGADGSRVKAAAVCHTDTSGWNPKHLAFQVLKVKPGTPVCHFLPEDHVVWVSK